MLNIVLYQPQIPQNTGNIVRTCACIGASLTLVRPLGFDTSSKQLRRAGLDYWLGVQVEQIDDIANYLTQSPYPAYLFSSHATLPYTDITYPTDCHLVFGSETGGLPEDLAGQRVTLPMKEEQRCLNLSNAVAIAAYEVGRQHNFQW